MTVRFQKDASSVDLPNPNYPGAIRPARTQVKNGAIGGRVVVSDLTDGTNLAQPRLTWTDPGLITADYNALFTFLDGTVKRSELSFTLTDWDSNTYTVIYWDGLDDFNRIKYDRFGGTIVLREIPT